MKESFLNFCQAIEQTAKIHNSQQTTTKKHHSSRGQTKISRLNSSLSYEIKKTSALNRINEDKNSVSVLLNQPEDIKVGNIDQENVFIDENSVKIDLSVKRPIWGKKEFTNKEPILNLSSNKRRTKLKPISSASRQLMVEPPLFLKKQNS